MTETSLLVTFPAPLTEGELVSRYKRFFADVKLDDGSVVTAHCPNTGSMKTCGSPGDRVLLSFDDNPKRKLKYTWELTRTDSGYVGVNTARPNQVIYAAVSRNLIPGLDGYHEWRQEVKYGENSRIDVLLTAPGRPACYVEVKNTTLSAGSAVQFPDAVTSRGLKHLQELAAVAARGDRAVMLFFVNRPEGEFFTPADDIDPDYAATLRKVARDGVELLAVRASHSPGGIGLAGTVEIRL